jgi:hypothetical protein
MFSPMRVLVPAILLCALSLAGCTTARQTTPLRTATEQLLISSAADRAAAQLSVGIPRGTRVYLDTRYFQGYDEGYAEAAIRTQMLKGGLALVDDRDKAEAVVMVSAGALSTDTKSMLIGVPALQFPFIPVGTSISVPEIALFKTAEDKGVAKFVATGYDAKTGKLIATTDPRYGFAHNTNHVVLLFFSWSTGDLIPSGVDQNSLTLSNSITSMLPGQN